MSNMFHFSEIFWLEFVLIFWSGYYSIARGCPLNARRSDEIASFFLRFLVIEDGQSSIDHNLILPVPEVSHFSKKKKIIWCDSLIFKHSTQNTLRPLDLITIASIFLKLRWQIPSPVVKDKKKKKIRRNKGFN